MQELQKLLELSISASFMKIGIFDPYLDTLSGGEKYMLSAALCLSQKHNVSLFWNIDKSGEIIHNAQRKFGIDLTRIQFKENIFSSHVPLVIRLKESLDYDLIVYLSDRSIPTVLTSLILHFQTPIEWVNATSIKSRIKIKRVKSIICNSKFTKGYIDNKFSVKSNVVYPPVTVHTEFLKNNKENVILNVGRLGIKSAGSSYKKQEVLVEVFKDMVRKGLRNWVFRLVVSVNDQDMDEFINLKNQAKDFPVAFILNPDNKVLWENYNLSKIYWHAAGFGEDLNKYPDRAEHFGISTVEAMGAGAVPVVINAGGQQEIVHEGLDGFLWNDENELINKTMILIKDEGLWEKLSSQSRIQSKLFSKDNFCRSLNSLIQ